MIEAANQTGLVHGMHLDDGWVIFWLIIGAGFGYWLADLANRARGWAEDGYGVLGELAYWATRALMLIGGGTVAWLVGKSQGWW
jgi:hypothetical protein